MSREMTNDEQVSRLAQIFDKYADQLSRQGSLVRKREAGSDAWHLRFMAVEAGRKVQKSVLVARDDQPEMVAFVKQQLNRLRANARKFQNLQSSGILMKRINALARRLRREYGSRARNT